ncbi:MAG TPA: hypothetical protein VN840_17325 [Streptosporangiaceae bacterium]|nr:hypothetical protein [Streptosporangiaceae bacterium]
MTAEPSIGGGSLVAVTAAFMTHSAGRCSAGPAGRRAENVGMLATVMLGQDGTGLTGSACDGALADLAADHRKTADGHGEATGT